MNARIMLRNVFYGGVIVLLGIGLLLRYFSSATQYTAKPLASASDTGRTMQPNTTATQPYSTTDNIRSTPAENVANSFQNEVGLVLKEGIRITSVTAKTPTIVEMDFQYVPGAQISSPSMIRNEFAGAICDQNGLYDDSGNPVNVEMVVYAANGGLVADLPTIGVWDCKSR